MLTLHGGGGGGGGRGGGGGGFPATAAAVEHLYVRCLAAEMGQEPPLSAAETTDGARALSAHTGASPVNTNYASLQEFVGDWYRWHSHVRRGARGRGGGAPAHADAPGMYSNILTAAAAADLDEADAAFDAARNAARFAAGGVPPLPAMPPSNYTERTPGEGMGGARSSMTPPGSARSCASARSSHAGDDDIQMNAEEVMAEVSAAISPAELAGLSTAAAAGTPCDVNLKMGNAQLSIIAKQIELVSSRDLNTPPHRPPAAALTPCSHRVRSCLASACPTSSSSVATLSSRGSARPSHAPPTTISSPRLCPPPPPSAWKPIRSTTTTAE